MTWATNKRLSDDKEIVQDEPTKEFEKAAKAVGKPKSKAVKRLMKFSKNQTKDEKL